MKKSFKGIITAFLCLAITCPTACAEQQNASSGKPSAPAKDYTVWATNTYEKFKQDDFSKVKEGAVQVNIEAVKNEYESAQLLISTSDDISSYYLEKSDLTCGENTLSAEHVQVYNVLYVELSSERDLANYGSGMYPDALVPIEKAKEAGELKAAANTNVSLWIRVYVPKETAAGEYHGNFTLTVDGKETSVPVSLTVYDYTLTDENHAPSMFTYRQDRIGIGELDNSTAMMEYYYDYFSDYRIMLQELPIESLTPSELADAAVKYYDQMSTFSLLSAKGNITTNFSRNKESIRAQILELAKRSTAEKNLISKAAIYCMDEPNVQGEDSDNVIQKAIDTMNDWYSMLNEIVETIAADTSGAYANFKNYPDWENQIKTIPNIIPHTIGSMQWIIGNRHKAKVQEYLISLETLCPVFTTFDDATYYDLMDIVEEYDLNLWWYGCTNPQAPYPTYHIGDLNLLSSRAVSWLQMKYNVGGNLYWGAAGYATEDEKTFEYPVDVYEYPYMKSNGRFVGGDGYLAYPGARYGIYGPIPSMRLMSVRDGLEDYELLYALKEKYADLKESAYADLNVEDMMQRFYSSLSYRGTNMNLDGQNGLDFSALRTELVRSIMEINDDCEFVIGSTSIEENKATVVYYAKEGYNVTIDGKKQTPVDGNKYEYTLDLSVSEHLVVKIENGTESYEYTKHIGTPLISLITFDAWTQENVAEYTLLNGGEGSEVTLTEDLALGVKNKGLWVKALSKFVGDDYKDATFKPYVKISTQAILGEHNIAELSYVGFNVFNASGSDISVEIKLEKGNKNYSLGTYNLKAGANEVVLTIDRIEWAELANTKYISILFENAGNIDAPVGYEIALDNFHASK
jgi:hypothetical protein